MTIAADPQRPRRGRHDGGAVFRCPFFSFGFPVDGKATARSDVAQGRSGGSGALP